MTKIPPRPVPPSAQGVAPNLEIPSFDLMAAFKALNEHYPTGMPPKLLADYYRNRFVREGEWLRDHRIAQVFVARFRDAADKLDAFLIALSSRPDLQEDRVPPIARRAPDFDDLPF